MTFEFPLDCDKVSYIVHISGQGPGVCKVEEEVDSACVCLTLLLLFTICFRLFTCLTLVFVSLHTVHECVLREDEGLYYKTTFR